MKILLIGKTGQLGGDLLRNGAAHEIHAHDETTLDITVPDAVRAAIADLRPDVVINTAAFHNVPKCETEPLEAFRVNCVAVRDLAAACNETGCRLVTFSSDYVFGGRNAPRTGRTTRPARFRSTGSPAWPGNMPPSRPGPITR